MSFALSHDSDDKLQQLVGIVRVVVMMCMQRSLDYALQSGYCGNDADEDDLIHAPSTTHGGLVIYLEDIGVMVSGYLRFRYHVTLSV